ncbi:MAG: circularly permuted type 2 ATP-grasp protein [Planctomycetes bacterium]|nr:circularly permuted type 2 ATP-grasp protein [Planctomycetota bacterium]
MRERPARGSEVGSKTVPLFADYRPLEGVWDELFEGPDRPREEAASVIRLVDALGKAELRSRHRLADVTFRKGGVTFSVYSDTRGTEKIFPFDLVPRVIPRAEWTRIERGLLQRVEALDRFLEDVAGPRRILAEGRVPAELVLGSRSWSERLRGLPAPGGVRVHVAGVDLIRRPDGALVVLEDNVRTPSGVSYVLENRAVMKRVLPGVFDRVRVRPVDAYPVHLREALASCAPEGCRSAVPRVVVLTPGPYNSAYFEHSFLARRMGVDLVQGQDLFVQDDVVWVKTTHGPQRVDVIYRRIDDAFVDPEAFRPDSVLGVRGLVRALVAGNLTLANALGNGVADDKGIYPFVPDMIRFYLGEEPLLEQVPTFQCSRPDERAHVLAHLDELVVKSVDESGGYGMLIGPRSTREEREEFAGRIRAEPRKYIAQPVVELSCCPTWTPDGLAPRRVDLRPFVVRGRGKRWVLPGGLSRVALVAGSYVVNSSQGGGSKDTWVLGGEEGA